MVENFIILVFLKFIRFSIALGTIRSLRELIGKNSVMILALILAIYFETTSNIILSDLKIESLFFYSLIFEIIVGVIFGLIISLILEIFPFIGRLIDTLRGSQLSEQLAPELGTRDSELEMYGGLLILTIFINSKYFLKSLIFINHFDKNNFYIQIKKLLTFEFIIEITTAVMHLSFIIVFPLFIITFAIEIAFSILQKINPRLQIGTDLALLKSGIGVGFLFLIVISSEKSSFLLSKLLFKLFQS